MKNPIERQSLRLTVLAASAILALQAGCAQSPVSSLSALPVETRPVYACPPVRDYEVIGQISPSDRITLVGRNGDSWVAFRYNGNLGWVQRWVLDVDGNPSRLAEISPQPIVRAGVANVQPPAESSESGGLSWRDASKHLGEYATVCGPIISTHFASSSNGQPTFLNMGEDFPSTRRFVVLIWGEDRGQFPGRPEDIYDGRNLCVTGIVEVFEAVYEIEVDSASLIVVQ